jgi:excisionase family DNA binding protein
MLISLLSLEEVIAAVKQAVREEITALQPAAEQIDTSVPLKQKELAKELGVTPQTIIRWDKKGKIPSYKMGSSPRYSLSKVKKALEKK